MNQATIVYQCPHCRTKVEVGEDLVGQVVNCPNPDCEHPFKVEAPSAFPVSDDEAESVVRKGGAPEVTEVLERERVLLVRHPAVLRRRVGQTILSLLFIVGGLIAAAWGAAIADGWLGFGGLAFAIVGGLDMAYFWFLSLFVTLTVTTKRSILRKGLISKRTSEVEHDDVRNIQVDQNVVQRLLNIGHISISSAGQSTMEIIARGVPDPEGIASVIREHQP